MPSDDEMIFHHAVTQVSRETASDVSGSALAASYILQSQGQNFLSLRYNLWMTFDLTQQTLAGFQANSWQPLRSDHGKSETALRGRIHILRLDGAVSTGDMNLIWVSHPTTCFSGFKLSKLLAAANKSKLLLEACTAPCRELPKVKRMGDGKKPNILV